MKSFIALALLSMAVAGQNVEQKSATVPDAKPAQEENIQKNMPAEKTDKALEVNDEKKAEDKKVGSNIENMKVGQSLPDSAHGAEMMGVQNFPADATFEKLFLKGACPDVKNMENLQFKRLSGDWYLQRTDEPTAPQMLPSCHHAMFNVNDDGSFIAKEEVRIEDKTYVADNITGKFSESTVEGDFFGTKLRVQMEILDTDYDNYLIGYQCYDNIEFAQDKKLEPAHLITIGIASRNLNATEADLKKWEEIARARVPEIQSEKLAVILQGENGKCVYNLVAEKSGAKPEEKSADKSAEKSADKK